MRASFLALEPGGILVWQGGAEFDIDNALELGFEIMKNTKIYAGKNFMGEDWHIYDLVLQKSQIKDDESI